MGEDLEKQDGVVCLLQGWIGVEAMTEGLPALPRSVSGGGSAARHSSGDGVDDSANVIEESSSGVGWTRVHEGLIGKRVFTSCKNLSSESKKDREQKSARLFVAPETNSGVKDRL